MRLPELPEIKSLPTGEDILINMIQSKEQFLSVYRIDHFDITRRREGSRVKHLGTTDLTQVDKSELKEFYIHLMRKHLEEL